MTDQPQHRPTDEPTDAAPRGDVSSGHVHEGGGPSSAPPHDAGPEPLPRGMDGAPEGVDAFGRPLDGEYRWDDSRTGKTVGSWSFEGDEHWSKRRKGKNREAIDYYKQRSKAPGVEAGGGIRAQYCQECDGVVPLEYDQRKPADTTKVQTCPHCGAEVDPRVRRMFNWVEIDQPPPSDLAVVLPWLGGALVVVLAIVALLVLG